MGKSWILACAWLVGCGGADGVGGVEVAVPDAAPAPVAAEPWPPEASAPPDAGEDVDQADTAHVTCFASLGGGLGTGYDIFCRTNGAVSITWDGGACDPTHADPCPLGTPCTVTGPGDVLLAGVCQ
jgi:hypothetical protein